MRAFAIALVACVAMCAAAPYRVDMTRARRLADQFWTQTNQDGNQFFTDLDSLYKCNNGTDQQQLQQVPYSSNFTQLSCVQTTPTQPSTIVVPATLAPTVVAQQASESPVVTGVPASPTQSLVPFTETVVPVTQVFSSPAVSSPSPSPTVITAPYQFGSCSFFRSNGDFLWTINENLNRASCNVQQQFLVPPGYNLTQVIQNAGASGGGQSNSTNSDMGVFLTSHGLNTAILALKDPQSATTFAQQSHQPTLVPNTITGDGMVLDSVQAAYQGIQASVRQLAQQFMTNFAQIQQGGAVPGVGQLIVTGNGFGGALAQLAASDLAKNVQPSFATMQMPCVSFGSPRVGDIKFAKTYDQLVPGNIRVFNTEDILPTLPPAVWSNQTSGAQQPSASAGGDQSGGSSGKILMEHSQGLLVPFTENQGSYIANHVAAYKAFFSQAGTPQQQLGTCNAAGGGAGAGTGTGTGTGTGSR